MARAPESALTEASRSVPPSLLLPSGPRLMPHPFLADLVVRANSHLLLIYCSLLLILLAPLSIDLENTRTTRTEPYRVSRSVGFLGLFEPKNLSWIVRSSRTQPGQAGHHENTS